MKHLGDITKINGATVPVVNVIIGGSPCQDLSVAGKRAGLAGERSGLFMEQLRVIKEMRKSDEQRGRTGVDVRPRYMVWENVPGAFSSNKGADFGAVLQETVRVVCEKAPVIPIPKNGWPPAGCLTDVGGQWSIAWRVFDAQFWGVPQRRKRIALVADFGGITAPEILFERQGVSGDYPQGRTPWERASGNTETSLAFSDKCFDARGNGNGNIAPTITGDHGSRVNDYCPIVLQSAGFYGWNSITAAGVGLREESSPTLTAKKIAEPPIGVDTYNQCLTGDKAKTFLAGHQDPDGLPCTVYALQGSMIGREDKNGRQGDGVNKDVCFTLNTIDRHAVVYALDRASFNQSANALYDFEVSDGGINSTIVVKGPSAVAYEMTFKDFFEWVVRRLTPKECERLQGFPDGWTDIGEWIDSKGKVHKECADSARYRALGNSIAIPPWTYVLQRLSLCCGIKPTMASLFDGIGGFPYIWESLNGKGSCVWASEIEEFPIAVTKHHFQDKE